MRRSSRRGRGAGPCRPWRDAMNPLLLRQRDSEYPTRQAAVAAFLAGGWRESLADSLCAAFEHQLGRDSILDAVDGALERALTTMRPKQRAGGQPYFAGEELFALASKIARADLLDE